MWPAHHAGVHPNDHLLKPQTRRDKVLLTTCSTAVLRPSLLLHWCNRLQLRGPMGRGRASRKARRAHERSEWPLIL